MLQILNVLVLPFDNICTTPSSFPHPPNTHTMSLNIEPWLQVFTLALGVANSSDLIYSGVRLITFCLSHKDSWPGHFCMRVVETADGPQCEHATKWARSSRSHRSADSVNGKDAVRATAIWLLGSRSPPLGCDDDDSAVKAVSHFHSFLTLGEK